MRILRRRTQITSLTVSMLHPLISLDFAMHLHLGHLSGDRYAEIFNRFLRPVRNSSDKLVKMRTRRDTSEMLIELV